MKLRINKKLICITLCILLMTSLSGCFGGMEVNQRLFVQLMGIDKTDEMYVVSIQSYNGKISGGQTDTTDANMNVHYGEGSTIYSAIADAEKRQGKQFFLGHIKLLVISDNLKSPAKELSIFLDSNISPGCPVVYSDEPAKIVSTKLTDGVFSAEYLLQLMDSAAIHGETIYTSLMSLTENSAVLGISSILPIVKSDGENITFDGLTFISNSNVISNNIAVRSVSLSEIPTNDVMGVKILNDNFTGKDRYTLPVSIGDKTATVIIVDSKTYKKADIYDDCLRIKATVSISMQITENPYGLEKKQIEKAVRESLNDTIISAFSTAVWYNKCDIFDIYKLVRKYCPNYLNEYNNDTNEFLENSILDIVIHDRVIG